MQQRIVRIYLDNREGEDCQDRVILAEELSSGWKVVSITPAGAGGAPGDGGDSPNQYYLAGWVLVLLEKS